MPLPLPSSPSNAFLVPLFAFKLHNFTVAGHILETNTAAIRNAYLVPFHFFFLNERFLILIS